MNILIFAFFATLVVCILLFAALQTLPNVVNVPVGDWPLAIQRATRNRRPLHYGWRAGSLRKRIILGSQNPSSYSTEDWKNIVIAPEDCHDNFMVKCFPRQTPTDTIPLVYGFFHPYCNAGGGGEKVLWKAVEETLNKDTDCRVVIYTGDDHHSTILDNVKNKFGYTLDHQRIVFVKLTYRHLVDAQSWPRFTLIGQALGSMLLTAEAVWKLPPDVFIDTMGYPFGYPVAHYMAKIPIVAYVHYPVVSSDMLGKLGYTLRERVKYVYWSLMMLAYNFVGTYAGIVLTNSTWTNNHIRKVWSWSSANQTILYPPCSTEKLVPPAATKRLNQAVMIAQFRPEKRHNLLITEYAKFMRTKPVNPPKLILIGSTRGDNDLKHVEYLKSIATEEKVDVEFVLNVEYSVIQEYLATSTYGINPMWNEHFGISVVEYAAAGLIPICHASAGPLLDIVVPWDSAAKCDTESSESTRTGFFFKDVSDPDYTEGYPKLSEVFAIVSKLSEQEKKDISSRGMERCLNKFSDKQFDLQWDTVLNKAGLLDRIFRNEKAEPECRF